MAPWWRLGKGRRNWPCWQWKQQKLWFKWWCMWKRLCNCFKMKLTKPFQLMKTSFLKCKAFVLAWVESNGNSSLTRTFDDDWWKQLFSLETWSAQQTKHCQWHEHLTNRSCSLVMWLIHSSVMRPMKSSHKSIHCFHWLSWLVCGEQWQFAHVMHSAPARDSGKWLNLIKGFLVVANLCVLFPPTA